MKEKKSNLENRIESVLSLVAYGCTNESLPAIINGLDLSRKDSVLAIAGSGDQAFAMLEYAGSVKVVDRKKNQIELVKLRAEALQAGDYELFFKESIIDDLNYYEEREKYFSKKGRLDRIRKNLKRLVIEEPSDIFKTESWQESFSKVYLSNALDYSYMRGRASALCKFAQKFSPGALIYVAESGLHIPPRGICMPEKPVLPNLVVDKKLTRNAQNHEVFSNRYGYWTPVVYRRTQK